MSYGLNVEMHKQVSVHSVSVACNLVRLLLLVRVFCLAGEGRIHCSFCRCGCVWCTAGNSVILLAILSSPVLLQMGL
jgi:hypothetical protein